MAVLIRTTLQPRSVDQGAGRRHSAFVPDDPVPAAYFRSAGRLPPADDEGPRRRAGVSRQHLKVHVPNPRRRGRRQSSGSGGEKVTAPLSAGRRVAPWLSPAEVLGQDGLRVPSAHLDRYLSAAEAADEGADPFLDSSRPPPTPPWSAASRQGVLVHPVAAAELPAATASRPRLQRPRRLFHAHSLDLGRRPGTAAGRAGRWPRRRRRPPGRRTWPQVGASGVQQPLLQAADGAALFSGAP